MSNDDAKRDDKLERFDALLLAASNASFECGQYDGDDMAGYRVLQGEAAEAKKALREFVASLIPSAEPACIAVQRATLEWLQTKVFFGEAPAREHDRYARGAIQEVLNNMAGGVTDAPSVSIPSPVAPANAIMDNIAIAAHPPMLSNERAIDESVCKHGYLTRHCDSCRAPSSVAPATVSHDDVVIDQLELAAKMWAHMGVFTSYALNRSTIEAAAEKLRRLQSATLPIETRNLISTAAFHLRAWATYGNRGPYANTLDVADRLDALLQPMDSTATHGRKTDDKG